MTADEGNERARVHTRVPKYQKEEWKEHADELGMSQSEFVRTMVQAGRRDFEIRGESSTPEEADDRGSDPRGDGLEDRVQSLLDTEGVMSWEELLAAVSEDIEARLDETLDTLQTENQIRYSGRDGGYVLNGE